MKTLYDITPEELQNLYKVNKKLQELTTEEANEQAAFWIDETLTYFNNVRGIDYNIGYPGNYFTVKQEAYKDFIEAAQNLAKELCVLSPETEKRLARAAARVDFFDDARNGYENISDEKYNNLEKWLDKIISDTAAEIVKFCDDIQSDAYTEEGQKNALDMFIENSGRDYVTDGRYIYEAAPRKYA